MKTLLINLLLLGATSLSIQAQTNQRPEDQKTIELRQRLNIDYSMPDFSTKKINGKIIGERLAKMLLLLEKNYKHKYDNYNLMLAYLRSEVLEEPKIRYVGIDKMKILKIKKVGNVITIRFGTSSKSETFGKLNHEFDIKFDKGISDNDTANMLFSELSRYIKEDL